MDCYSNRCSMPVCVTASILFWHIGLHIADYDSTTEIYHSRVLNINPLGLQPFEDFAVRIV